MYLAKTFERRFSSNVCLSIREVIRCGGDITLCDNAGRNCLHYAGMFDNVLFFQCLDQYYCEEEEDDEVIKIYTCTDISKFLPLTLCPPLSLPPSQRSKKIGKEKSSKNVVSLKTSMGIFLFT